jgi:hypothetical protein
VRHTPSRTPSPISFRALAVGVAALALAACGGGDDDEQASPTTAPIATTTAAATTEAPATTAATTTEAPATTAPASTTPATAPSTTTGDDLGEGGDDGEDGEDGDVVIVDDVSDLPTECVDLLADFLKTIEPAVSDIDWDTATLGDFQAISDSLESQFTEMDAREIELGCDNYDLSSDQAAMEAAIAIAEQEAPGAVGWLEFVASLSQEPTTDAADPALDCEGAIAYIDGLIASGSTMTDVPFSEVNRITGAITVITTECSPEQADEFLAREDVNDFMS